MRFIPRFLLLCLFLVFCGGAGYAQRKEISAAQDQLKSGKDLDKAQQSMEKLLQDSANRDNQKIRAVLFAVLCKKYEQGNEKLYLKQKQDTATIFQLTRQMFSTAFSLDSLDAAPDRKGRVKLKYRDDHARYLNGIRPNLYNGGLYYILKQDFKTGYDFMDTYIDCANQPLLRKYNYAGTDRLLPEAAYWAVYCGYKLKDPTSTLHHTYLALKDTAHYVFMLQYLAETYKLEEDTTRYLNTLKEGFSKYPSFPFFFPRLVDYYAGRGDYHSAMDVTEQALRHDPRDPVYRFTKSTLLLNLRQYAACISLCDSLISEADTLPLDRMKNHPASVGAYLNAGLAWFNQGVELDKDMHSSRRERSRILSYYRKALPYLQRYRELAPDDQSKWALPLYTIYLNLNMGKEFDEMDELLKKMK